MSPTLRNALTPSTRHRRQWLVILLVAAAAAAFGIFAASLGTGDAPQVSTPFQTSPKALSGPDLEQLEEDLQSFPRPAPMTEWTLIVPALGVVAPVTIETTIEGEMTLPEDPSLVGMNVDAAAIDASAGSVLISGHVTRQRERGALYDLHRLKPGTVAVLEHRDGQQHWFMATSLTEYEKQALPASVRARTGDKRLTLVTCGGPVITVDGQRVHRDNIVASFDPVPR